MYEPHANIAYCLERNTSKPGDEVKISPASTTDLAQLRDSINVMSQISDYNFYSLKTELAMTKKTIHGLILNLVRTNPNVFSSLFNKRVYTRLMEKNIVEICPCADEVTCKEREEHHPGIGFCFNNSIEKKRLELFPSSAKIMNIGPATLLFQGIDTNPIMDLLEKEFTSDRKVTTSEEDKSGGYFSFSILGMAWSAIVKYSGLCCLIVLVNVVIFGRR